MESKILRIVVALGVPGVALGVFYLLLRGFGFNFAPINPVWSAMIAIVFLILVSGITTYALHLWRPTSSRSESPQNDTVTQSVSDDHEADFGKPYRLGFSLAKVAWHSGENLQWCVLQEQVNTFAADLSLPKEIIATTLAQFTLASDPEALLRNARSGIEARNAIGSIVESRLGARAAAAFRLGFGIVNVMPQFEFLSMGQQAGLPFQELAGPIASQIGSLTEDAALVGIPEKSVAMLKTIDSDPKNADAARMLLMMIGGAIDKELNGAR